MAKNQLKTQSSYLAEAQGVFRSNGNFFLRWLSHHHFYFLGGLDRRT